MRRRASVGEDMPHEQARVRKILRRYEALGTAGMPGARLIADALRRAELAVIGGDILQILRAYYELQSIED